MAIPAPTVSGVTPGVNDTDAALKPTIQIVFGGAGLIDPLTWGDNTFALYGPGDVVLEEGPGSILNSGLEDAPYPLLDGPLRRDRVEGTYDLILSGTSGLDTAVAEARMGASGLTPQFMIAQFTPTSPLNPNTQYVAVIAGDDIANLLNSADRRFPGVTTFTSPSGFALSGTGAIVSGFVEVARPYSRTLETSLHDAITGQNDTYEITITSGSSSVGFKYSWSKASSPGTFTAVVSGTTDRHDLGDGLLVDFDGTFLAGEVYSMDVFIPQALANSVVWKFDTGTIESFDSPPSVPDPISVVIEPAEGGGYGVDTTVQEESGLYVVGCCPEHLDYAVYEGLPYIAIEFNKELVSGVYDASNVVISTTPLLGIGAEPDEMSPTNITASMLETSGKFLKIWL